MLGMTTFLINVDIFRPPHPQKKKREVNMDIKLMRSIVLLSNTIH